MRWTTGPLPSAVYWRRRVVVLAAPLALILITYASCSGPATEPKKQTAAEQANTDVSTDPTDSDTDTGEPGVLGSAGTSPTASSSSVPSTIPAPVGAAAQVSGGAPVAPPGLGVPLCDDAQLTVTPVPAKATLPVSSPIDIRLIIQNSSAHACARDVGADVQELRIVRGAETIWSSDHCGAARGTDVRAFPAAGRREYMVTWNGHSSTSGDKCTAGMPAGPVTPGTYQLVGRVGSKTSNPVTLTLSAS